MPTIRPDIRQEIQDLLWSLDKELQGLITKLEGEERPSDQDLDLWVNGMERRDHALRDRLRKVCQEQPDYQMPNTLLKKIQQEVERLQQDRSLQARIAQVVARHPSFWPLLRRMVQETLRSETYKIKIDPL